MYMSVKQLSKAMPMRKREKANRPNVVETVVMTPAKAPIKLHKIRAGMRPKRSAMKPRTIPPTILPPKKTACANGAWPALSHTQSFYIDNTTTPRREEEKS